MPDAEYIIWKDEEDVIRKSRTDGRLDENTGVMNPEDVNGSIVHTPRPITVPVPYQSACFCGARYSNEECVCV